MTIEAEAKALESLNRLLRLVDECRALFDEAGMDYPAPLKRLLNVEGRKSATAASHTVHIDPPTTPHRPAGVSSTWIYVPIPSLAAQTFVLGVLRDADEPMSAKEITDAARARGLTVSTGSVANVGTRFEAKGWIERIKGQGWLLTDGSVAPVLSGDYAWGPSEIFTRQELAARRREMILYVLDHFPEGLQNLQILARLESCDWLGTPVTKDLVKADMDELQREGMVRRRGNSKKWVRSTAT